MASLTCNHERTVIDGWMDCTEVVLWVLQ